MTTNDEAARAAVELMQKAEGWLFPREARLLFNEVVAAAAHDPEGRIVEIGSFKGRSTIILGHAAKLAQQAPRVYAIDPHEGNLPRGLKVPPTWETFCRNIQEAGLDQIVVPVPQKAADVQWSNQISALFIDGLHDYANVAADYRKFSSFVQPGGTIAFHDYSNPDHPDVARFVDERIRSGELSVAALPDNPGREASLIVTRKRASFSIVIPTCGRETLERTLQSIVAAGALPVDEVIVVGDGSQPTARAIVSKLKNIGVTIAISYFETKPTRAVGAHQRNFAMEKASRSHLLFIDDDDAYLPDALRWMREAAEENPARVILFKEEEKREKIKWGVVWQEKRVYYGNVGTQMIVLPNRKEFFGHWPDRRGSDYEFIRSTLDRWPGGEAGVVWVDRVVAYLY